MLSKFYFIKNNHYEFFYFTNYYDCFFVILFTLSA